MMVECLVCENFFFPPPCRDATCALRQSAQTHRFDGLLSEIGGRIHQARFFIGATGLPCHDWSIRRGFVSVALNQNFEGGIERRNSDPPEVRLTIHVEEFHGEIRLEVGIVSPGAAVDLALEQIAVIE